MKKVLWISYLYPPLNCGVGRQVKIAKYLPANGWLPVVLSVKRSRLRPVYDHNLLKDIPPEATVHRTWSLESKVLMQGVPYLFHLNYKWFHIPDQFIGWLPFALRKGQQILAQEKVDAIFSTSLPNTCHLVAYYLKRKSGLPWIADFRDSWTQNTYVTYPRRVLALENRMERAVVMNADRITTINEFITHDIRAKYPEEPASKFSTISHGFDPQDFPSTGAARESERNRLTITYTGTLYGKRRVDGLLYALQSLLKENAELNDRLNVRLVGRVEQARPLCNRLQLNHVVSFSDVVTHEEAWNRLRESDVLLFILGVGDLDEKASTGKIFEYLAIRKPVLALAPEGMASDMLRQANVGTIVNPEDQEAIKGALKVLYSRWVSGDLRVTPNMAFIEQFDVRNLSARFAAIFNEIAEHET